MKDALLVFRKELTSFIGSDRGLFVVYAVIGRGLGLPYAGWKAETALITMIWLASSA